MKEGYNQFSFCGYYRQSKLNETKIKYITYIQSMTTDGGIGQDGIILNLPKDISPNAKSHGLQIPLRQTLSSGSNAMLLISLTGVTILGNWQISPKLRRLTAQEHAQSTGVMSRYIIIALF
jgi:hypothetical protein